MTPNRWNCVAEVARDNLRNDPQREHLTHLDARGVDPVQFFPRVKDAPMRRLILVAILAVSATVAAGNQAKAQNPHPHFPPFGCGGFCIGFLSKLHFHGPLYNYGPYAGYYPFEPYGPWTSNLQYNPPPMSCDRCGHGDCSGRGWGRYAIDTLKNVFHRTNPLANRCGVGLNLGKCGCSSAGTCR